MKRFLSAITLATTLATGHVAASSADPAWKMHPTFDMNVTRIAAGPDYIYFTSQAQPYTPGSKGNGTEYLSLFRYDRKGDEMLPLSTDNILSTNTVQCIEYSPEKKCLAVVHHSGDIDLLYDNGNTASINAYRIADVKGDKKVNSIFFDNKGDRIYLATEFGYVAINPKKLEISESRVYGAPVKSVARIGDSLLLLQGDKLLSAPISATRFNLSDYTAAAVFNNPAWMKPVGEGILALEEKNGNSGTLYKLEASGTGITKSQVEKGTFYNAEPNPNGLSVTSTGYIVQFMKDGSVDKIGIEDRDPYLNAASYDMQEFWFATRRKGLWSKRRDAASGQWAETRGVMTPNAPAPFKATDLLWHPEHGILVANHGTDPNFSASASSGPLLISRYKDGIWENVSPIYTAPQYGEALNNPNGLAVDPFNPDYAYVGSMLYGMERVNLSDGEDVIHLSRPGDGGKDKRGFHVLVDDASGLPSPSPNLGSSWNLMCPFSPPQFDWYGNMWTSFADFDHQTQDQLHFFVWKKEDRLASTPDNIIPPVRVCEKGWVPNTYDYLLPMRCEGQRDLLVYTDRQGYSSLAVIDTNGTPADPSDDKVTVTSKYQDQDGIPFTPGFIYHLAEDPATGLVWAVQTHGVFTFNPKALLEGKNSFNRIKVSRNDGTNLADYLLDGVRVNRIAIDGKGRKWFATSGAGIVCTSPDGKVVESEFNTGNSPIPSDVVFGIAYNPDSNSIMMSTDNGICEYFIPGGKSPGSESSVRAYPNPVRPGYAGHVTIDGLPSGTLVKITDASGNIIKELGSSAGGEVTWDVTDTSFRRAGSGVYFILTSPQDDSTAPSLVGKIVVVN